MTNAKNLSVESVVEKRHGHWVVYIPLDQGGRQLMSVTRGLSDIEGDRLKIVLPGWLTEGLAIKLGSRIAVDSREGQFSIYLI